MLLKIIWKVFIFNNHACAVSQVVHVNFRDHLMLQRNVDGHEVVLKDVSQVYIPLDQLLKIFNEKTVLTSM